MNAPWVSRITGYGLEAPDQLLANDQNWRVHPISQRDALAGVLDTVGIVQNVIVNRRTSDAWPVGERNVETLVDGHLRVSLALSRDEPTIPVTYVDLDPNDERLILATLDPLAGLAATDAAKLDELLREVTSDDAAVQALLADLAKDAGLYRDAPKEETVTFDTEQDRYTVVVICDDADHQVEVAARLRDEGYACRVVSA